MQDTVHANNVTTGDFLEPLPVTIPPKVPGNYRQRLANKITNLGALAGRRGGRKSVGIPVMWVENPADPFGEFVRILVGKPPRDRELTGGKLGQMKMEAAEAKRNRKNQLRTRNEARRIWGQA